MSDRSKKNSAGSGSSASRGGRQGGPPRRGDRGRGEDDTVAQLAGPLQNVLKRLPATQREVIEWRMGLKDGHPHDLADTARQLGLSMSEARDIEKRAFEHIREVVPLDRLQKLLKG
jgi:DNA-directed RNA polymerase specialized sigma24 family protein